MRERGGGGEGGRRGGRERERERETGRKRETRERKDSFSGLRENARDGHQFGVPAENSDELTPLPIQRDTERGQTDTQRQRERQADIEAHLHEDSGELTTAPAVADECAAFVGNKRA